MSEPTATDLRDNVYRRAQYQLAALAESRSKLIDEHSAAFRWLIASLLAVNGGSALALFGNQQIGYLDKFWAGTYFSIGILLALVCAYFSQGAARRMFAPIGALASFWINVESAADFDEEHYKLLLKDVDTAAAGSLRTRIAGWLSAIAFCAGVLSVGRSLLLLNNKQRGPGSSVEMQLRPTLIPSQGADMRD